MYILIGVLGAEVAKFEKQVLYLHHESTIRVPGPDMATGDL